MIEALIILIGVVWHIYYIHRLMDERDEAREYAEQFQEELRARPVKVRTIIYAEGEKVRETLS